MWYVEQSSCLSFPPLIHNTVVFLCFHPCLIYIFKIFIPSNTKSCWKALAIKQDLVVGVLTWIELVLYQWANTVSVSANISYIGMHQNRLHFPFEISNYWIQTWSRTCEHVKRYSKQAKHVDKEIADLVVFILQLGKKNDWLRATIVKRKFPGEDEVWRHFRPLILSVIYGSIQKSIWIWIGLQYLGKNICVSKYRQICVSVQH